MNKQGDVFVVDRQPWSFDYRIGFGRREGHDFYVAKPAELALVDKGQLHEGHDYLLTLRDESVALLMDQLWIAGVRPSKALIEKTSEARLDSEVKWLRETADHLMKKPRD